MKLKNNPITLLDINRIDDTIIIDAWKSAFIRIEG